MRGLLLTTVVVLSMIASAASAQNAPHRGDPRQGRSLAVQKCDVCHIVASNQQIPPLVPHYAPSFYDLANRPGGDSRILGGVSREAASPRNHALPRTYHCSGG